MLLSPSDCRLAENTRRTVPDLRNPASQPGGGLGYGDGNGDHRRRCCRGTGSREIGGFAMENVEKFALARVTGKVVAVWIRGNEFVNLMTGRGIKPKKIIREIPKNEALRMAGYVIDEEREIWNCWGENRE